MNNARRLNKILTTLFNNVWKVEEAVLKKSKVHHLSITEIHTLEAIGQGKSKTMTHVAAMLKINGSTLTAAMNKLVTKGYVNRFRIPEDRRMVMLELTAMGKKAVREHEAFHLIMVRDALAQLSPQETERFIESLASVNEFMLMRRTNHSRKEMKTLTAACIYQGSMGIGISMSRLAAAVAICGGVGMISASEPGYREEDYNKNSFEANKRALQRNIKEALSAVKKAGGKGLIGINILYAVPHYEEYVKAALDAGVQVIVSSGGIPTALPGLCKGKNVKLIPVIYSARAASVIIRNWAKKYNRMPDALIFEGPFAAGYLGYKEGQLGTAQENFYKMIAQIKNETENLPGCQLIVGGGIYQYQDAQKVMACGADGVQLGSRFVTTEECDAHDNMKQAYINCRESDIGVVTNSGGMSCRVLKNRFTEKLGYGAEVSSDRVTEALIAAAAGDMENGLIFCGSKAYKAARIDMVKDVFDEFMGTY